MLADRPSLVNVQTVALVDFLANGILFHFVKGQSGKQIAFKLGDGDTPTEVARSLVAAAKAIEGLEDPTQWEHAPKKTRRRKK